MQVKELIAALQEIDGEEDIFMNDNEYGPTEIFGVDQTLHHVITETGRQLPRAVWCLH